MNTLITGLHGYISTHLKEHFDKFLGISGGETKLLDLRGAQWKDEDFSAYDTIIHCAALVHKDDTRYSLQDYLDVNTQLTLELAEKAKRKGISYFVFFSTEGVYGTTGSFYEPVVLTKERKPRPIKKYEISKFEAEKELQKMADENFQLAIVRPPFVYGRDCPGNYSRLRNIVLKYGCVPKIDNQKSMIYIENLCEFVYQICKRRAAGIFLPQDLPYRCTADMCRLIAKYNGKRLMETGVFNPLIRLASNWIRSLRVSFGSEYYSAKESEMEFIYSLIDFEESIKRIENDY